MPRFSALRMTDARSSSSDFCGSKPIRVPICAARSCRSLCSSVLAISQEATCQPAMATPAKAISPTTIFALPIGTTFRSDRRRDRLQSEHGDQFADRGRRFLQGGIFVGGELNFDDFFGTLCAELYRYSHEKAFDPVFAFEIHRAGKNFLFVF